MLNGMCPSPPLMPWIPKKLREYYKGKEKDPEKWENGWKKDKAGFANTYVEMLSKDLKKTSLKISSDDPDSKYKMIVRPMKLKTGTPVRYSSIEMKIHVIDMATNEEVAVLHVPEVRGVQWGMTTPTGYDVNVAIRYSAKVFSKFSRIRSPGNESDSRGHFVSFGLQVSAQDSPEISWQARSRVLRMDFSFLKLIHRDGFVDKNASNVQVTPIQILRRVE